MRDGSPTSEQTATLCRHLVFFITAFFLASNGAHSIIITSNEIYGIKGRDFIGRRLKAIVITLILVFVIIFILIVPIFGELILESLRSLLL